MQRKIEELEQALLQANRLADHDHLTGLANRRLLEARFTFSAALALRNGKQLALLFLDLDNFKSINDEFGHDTGDFLLREFGLRLSASVRSVDTVCRYGGDEFAVLLTELASAQALEKAVQKILQSLLAAFDANGSQLRVEVSHGLGIFPDDGDDLAAVMARADQKMYRDKDLPREQPPVH